MNRFDDPSFMATMNELDTSLSGAGGGGGSGSANGAGSSSGAGRGAATARVAAAAAAAAAAPAATRVGLGFYFCILRLDAHRRAIAPTCSTERATTSAAARVAAGLAARCQLARAAPPPPLVFCVLSASNLLSGADPLTVRSGRLTHRERDLPRWSGPS